MRRSSSPQPPEPEPEWLLAEEFDEFGVLSDSYSNVFNTYAFVRDPQDPMDLLEYVDGNMQRTLSTYQSEVRYPQANMHAMPWQS